ncbi:hypothetical protein [Kitasatospora sp. NPDC088548]|uniref:hypothetical protein n=1 Tax=Kitasatospora sp. NPDC088548 TaxID=3364075 RepID=UPI00381D574A
MTDTATNSCPTGFGSGSVLAMIRDQAAQAGAVFPEAVFEFLDASRLLGKDGLPSPEIISEAIAPFLKAAEPQHPWQDYTIPVLRNS